MELSQSIHSTMHCGFLLQHQLRHLLLEPEMLLSSLSHDSLRGTTLFKFGQLGYLVIYQQFFAIPLVSSMFGTFSMKISKHSSTEGKKTVSKETLKGMRICNQNFILPRVFQFQTRCPTKKAHGT